MHSEDLHPAVAEILQWFSYDHLSPALQAISGPFSELAHQLAHGQRGPVTGAELTVALRKLLEAKDAAVRAHLAATR